MSDVGGLQLLPNQKKRFDFTSSGHNGFLIGALVFLLLVGGAYFVLANMLTSKMAEIDGVHAQIEQIFKARNKAEEEKLRNFQKQLATTRTLLMNHTMFSVGFRDLQTRILPRVRFLSFSADARKSSYSFHAVADSYTTVARQVASFYGTETISDIKLHKVSGTANGEIDFTMELIFKPEGFLMQKK